MIRTIIKTLILINALSLVVLLPHVDGQIRAGAGYLKIMPGSREVSMAGTAAGALDHTYSYYANPGAVGFLREWQWSATYTNWMSDMYHASFLYGRRIRNPLSTFTKFALGVNYLGIPEFNSSHDAVPEISGNNLLFTLSMGQPINVFSHEISLGANVKYFRSELAQYEAHTMVYDFGILFRARRLEIDKLLDYLIFSTGMSLTNIGKPMTYISEQTPLPQTFRCGAALNWGSHRSFQMNTGIDYRRIRDEDGYISIGSEISWRQLISMRFGYSFENNVLGHVTFGGSFRFDDRMIKSMLPGLNNAFRFDLASNDNNLFFSSPYHGSIIHCPIGPESFNLLQPSFAAVVDQDSVILGWEKTRDPDLYDNFNYILLVDHDSLKLANIIQSAVSGRELASGLLTTEPFLINHRLHDTSYLMSDPEGGDYYWLVLAEDEDRHIRFARLHGRTIAKFHVTAPKPKIMAIDFEYGPWITEDDYQGVLKISVRNDGDRLAQRLMLSVYDSLLSNDFHKPYMMTDKTMNDPLIAKLPLAELAPDSITSVSFEWRTRHAGYHHIKAVVHPVADSTKIRDELSNSFYTIPKGTFAAADTVVALKLNKRIYELPYVGKIYFPPLSAEINHEYYNNWVMMPPLAAFAQRMKSDPGIIIMLQGTADPNSGEYQTTIADDRAQVVSDTLRKLGVAAGQIKIVHGVVLEKQKVPTNPTDAQWVFHERRRVDIMTDEVNEEKLFCPLQAEYLERLESPLSFLTDIQGAVPLTRGTIFIALADEHKEIDIQKIISGSNITQDWNWLPYQFDHELTNGWLDHNFMYALEITDSLKRQFRAPQQTSFAKKEIVQLEQTYYVIAQFALAKPFYNFYWSNLLDRVPILLKDEHKRIRFIGHGCAIGSEAINKKLSVIRAQTFQEIFLRDVNEKYPDLYDEIKKKIDPPQGHGEEEPISFKTSNGKTIILGDNDTPLGRQLNRRVMVQFYTAQ